MNSIIASVAAGLALTVLALAAVVAHSAADGDLACPSVDPAAIARGNSQFAFDLYARLRERDGNLFFSPYSISDALAMTSVGARGPTAAQMSKVLHFPAEGEALYPAFASLISSINGPGRERHYQLSVADALWGQKDYGFRPEFLKRTRECFGAGLHEVNFAGAPDESREKINRWVEKETQDRIKDLLPPGAVKPDTRLVLTNAIYFKASWANKFHEALTKPAPFTMAAAKKVEVPLMQITEDLNYLDAGAFQLVQLPYRSGELSMYVLLPKQADGLAEVEKSLNEANVARWLGELKTHSVDVTLPRFEFTTQFNLARTLSDMGMTLAFSSGADFTGMSDRENLFLSDVVHKAFVSVDEKGTEAAAATAILARPTAVIVPLPHAVFRADHPFVFLIREQQTGSILFLGRLTNPPK